MADDGVRLVKPGMKYEGAQGVTYDAGVSRNTVGAEKVCMNILPMPPGVKSKPHIHRGIETIAYMLEGECTLFHGEQLENQTLIKQGEQIFIPDNVPHAPYNLSDKKCVWVVVHSSGDDQDEFNCECCSSDCNCSNCNCGDLDDCVTCECCETECTTESDRCICD